ncbi:calcium-activated chloride channel regulator 4-like [Mytilus californianus]|uniref:calcium-activated chloride channel regulator 4-like n=1 Tax=Mytilus californianus TaxID=6549 RepID=UPI002247D5CD|nr:calcium-activated chloride channel regulator 4-like [Mytilus californianus]
MSNILKLVAFLIGFSLANSAVTLSGNGYIGVLVSIGDNVKEDSGLITKIQDWLTEASQKLYIASKYNVYLKEVTIRVPESWSNSGQYNLTSISSNKEGVIRIADVKTGDRNNPFVHGLPGCGLSGQYIHFTTDVLNQGNNGNYGNIGTVFVHEWGHYRWGLFDEYPTLRDSSGNVIRFDLFNGQWAPVRCTTQITGRIINGKTGDQCKLDSSGNPEVDCYFYPESVGTTNAVASIMGSSFIPAISQFCDSANSADASTRHNSMASNNQNRRCNGRSAWEVMRQHDDFQNKSPGVPFASTKPEFFLEQASFVGRFCLLIDVSGSMSGYILEARNALATVVQNVLPNDSYVGIVKFSSSATLIKSMTLIASEEDRGELASLLPISVGGSTSIGAGLQLCCQTLSMLSDVKGSKIYLATDGKENRAPMIADVLPDLLEKGIIVDTLAIGNAADDKLADVSQTTGGSSFFYSTSTQNSTALIDALTEPFVDSAKDPIIRINSLSIHQKQNENFETTFFIDESIGRETVIQLTANRLEGVNVTVYHQGNLYTTVGTSADSGVISVKIPNIAIAGEYTVTVMSSMSDVAGTISILSKAANVDGSVLKTEVLTTKSKIEYSSTVHFPLFVSINKGTAPVAKTVVVAYIENENGQTSSLVLKDNEIGADVMAGDGIYSGYILPYHITANGRHSIKVVAEGRNSTILVPSTRSAGKDFEEDKLEEETVGSFMRVSLAKEIVVQEYVYVAPENYVDVIPPSPILTLKLSDTRNNNNTFMLSWKAVGDDFDIGKAFKYDIRFSTNYSDLKSDPDNQNSLTSELVPKEAGELETYVFQIPNITTNITYFLTVRVIDKANNTGDLSNIVTVSVLTDQVWFQKTEAIDDDKRIGIGFVIGISIGSSLIVIMFLLWGVFLLKSRTVPRKSKGSVI